MREGETTQKGLKVLGMILGGKTVRVKVACAVLTPALELAALESETLTKNTVLPAASGARTSSFPSN